MTAFASLPSLGCLAGLMFVTGWAPPVNGEFKAGTRFADYKTFALMPLPHKTPADDPGMMLRLAEPAREAVISEMTAKGLSQAPPDKADLAVNLKGRSLPRIEVTDLGYTYPVMTRYGTYTVVQNPSPSVSTYIERTLIIEMLDNRSKEVVWVGWMKKDTSSKVTPEQLREAIHKILEKYPPPSTSK